MKDYQNAIAGIAVAVGLIVSSWIFVQGNRYQSSETPWMLDKATGTLYWFKLGEKVTQTVEEFGKPKQFLGR